MAEETSILTSSSSEEGSSSSSPLSSTNETPTISEACVDSEPSPTQKSMSIETYPVLEESSSSSSSSTSSTSAAPNTPQNDDLKSPRALQSLVLAATSDLLEESPRSMDLMDTPTSQAGTPSHANHSNASASASANATTSTTPESETKSKPKGILRKPRYTVSLQPPINDDISPTSGNTIHNINQARKNRRNTDFDFSEIDRMVDDDDEYSSENSGNATIMSMLWALIGLPIVLLGYGGLPYLVLASMVWTLLFVARWFRRFLVEEFSMRRNSDGSTSLNEATRNQKRPPIPPSVESPFSSASTQGAAGPSTPIRRMLASLSPMGGRRSTKVRFEEGIKFPERKLLRQPIRRIQRPPPPPPPPPKPHKKTRPMDRTWHKPLFFGDPPAEEDHHAEGETWSLDSLMVLRNYMKDHTNSENGVKPTPMSVLAPPPPYPPTSTNEELEAILKETEEPTATLPTTSTEDGASSGDEADDEGSCDGSRNSAVSPCSFEGDTAEHDDEVPELLPSSASDRRRRESVMFFPQEVVEEEDTAYETRYGHSAQPTIELEDDENELIDGFDEGLFGKSDSSSPNDSKLRKKSSRYRRRKPRDSLCFTFAKKTVVPECPSIPQCPSDELEYLHQKKQEKFEQAVVIEHTPEVPATTVAEGDSETELPRESSEALAPSETDSEVAVAISPSHSTGSKSDHGKNSASSDQENESLSQSEEEEEEEEEEDDDESDDAGTASATLAIGSLEQEETSQQLPEVSPKLSPCIKNNNEQEYSQYLDFAEEQSVEVSIDGLPIDGEHVFQISPEKILIDEEELNKIVVGLDEIIIDDDEQSIEVSLGELSMDDEEAVSLEELLLEGDSSSSGSTYDAMLEDLISPEEAASSSEDDLPIVNDLQVSSADEEATPNVNNVSKLSDEDVLSLVDDAIAMGIDAEQQLNELHESMSQMIEPENLPLDEEASTASNDSASQSDDLKRLPLDKETALSTDDALQFTDLQELSMESDDGLPQFIDLQEITFSNSSDDVECVLSPNALSFSENENLFRDRNPVFQIPLAETDTTTFDESETEVPNDESDTEVPDIPTPPTDLEIDKVATHEDVECILSPLPLADTDANAFTENQDIDDEKSALPSPESPENKENLNEKTASGTEKNNVSVDTNSTPTKALNHLSSPSPSALSRSAVLSPTSKSPRTAWI